MCHRFENPGCLSRGNSLLLIFTLALFASPIFAQLTLSPIEIEFSNLGQSKTIHVLNDGQPVLAAGIKSVVVGVFKTGDAVPAKASGGTHFSNYSYMFDFKISDDGSITVTPIEGIVQIGTYNLFVSTIHGRIEGVINTNFKGSIPARPARWIESSVFTYELQLSDYTYGQAVVIDLEPDNRHIYTWSIDGELHSSGLGESSFRAWPEIGSHEISLLVQNAAGETVSRWSGVVKIIAEEAVSKSVNKGDKVTFVAPRGHNRVTWSLNGKVLSDQKVELSQGSNQVIRFDKKGNQIVTCRVEGSENGNFRLMTWLVNVN